MAPTPRIELPDVLAVGAWLKNAACRLADPAACRALEASAMALLAARPRPVAAIAHDLHPDFFSTRLALRLADDLGVPSIGVQHHHAHIAAVLAEHSVRKPAIGLALDGVGLGTDGTAWGGELLRVDERGFARLGHLLPLALPGGDVAAREPWRMAASALHALGRGDEIETHFGVAAGAAAARGVHQMLERGLNCPPTSSAGRWFDAAAAALGLSVRQSAEAEAAIALEHAAMRWLASGREPVGAETACAGADGVIDLRPLLAHLFDAPAGAEDRTGRGAAWFHAALANALADAAAAAAYRADIDTVCLGGGCFFNAVLTARVTRRLEAQRLRVLRPMRHSCGDAALALGQAWVAAHALRASAALSCNAGPNESPPCASPSLHA
jgi:hydrogenase maturation protein HypF